MQDAKKAPSGHHRTTLSGYILTTKACIDNRKKNLLSSNISCTYPHNMVNFSLLAAEIVSLVWGTPANFNDFCILASLLQRRRSTEANQTFPNVWPLPGLVDYTHFRQLLLRTTILPSAKFTLHPPSRVLFYWQRYCTAVEQWAPAKLCGVEHIANDVPIFGRATIMLNTGPHSSVNTVLLYNWPFLQGSILQGNLFSNLVPESVSSKRIFLWESILIIIIIT